VVAAPLRPVVHAVAAALVASASACGVQGLAFVQDERVDIVRPADRAEVTLPVTVAWTVDRFDVGPARGSFGVFVDRAPPPSGRTIAWLFRDTDACRGVEGARQCATPEFLEQQQVFQTTATSLAITQVPRLAGRDRQRQLHEVTVVLLDEEGRRVGEGAWSVEFELKRRR
jgi:hypothetical protein